MADAALELMRDKGVPQAIPVTAATYQANTLGTPTQLNVAPNQT
jgi:hypothetical protein